MENILSIKCKTKILSNRTLSNESAIRRTSILFGTCAKELIQSGKGISLARR